MKKIEFKGLKFLLLVILILIAIALFDSSSFYKILQKFGAISYRLIPIFTLVITLTALINYFLKPKKIMKYFGKESGALGILYALIGGIISHGPMYAWYPMLQDMQRHGLKNSLIAIFLYARAVKLPLLPFMIALFGIKFTIIANLYIILFAIIQGFLIDWLCQKSAS